MTSESFSKNTLNFLKKPPIKSVFDTVSDNSLALNPSRRKSKEVQEYVDFGFSSTLMTMSPIFIICDRDPQKEDLAELCATLTQLRCPPRIFFIDSKKNVKDAITKFMHVVFEKLTPSPKTEPKIINSITGRYPRYGIDFIEEDKIGEGGFGTVYKVKSKYDHCMYAVKKIKLKNNDDAITNKILSEVQFLASLNHQNIIRYHSTWVEDNEDTESSIVSSTNFRTPHTPIRITEITDEEAACLQTRNSEVQFVEEPATPVLRKISSDSDGGSFASFSDEDECIKKVNGRFWNGNGDTSEDSEEPLQSVSTTPTAEIVVTERQLQRKISPPSTSSTPTVVRTVFIQMELCSKTLEQYLIERNAQMSVTKFPVINGSFNRDLCIQLLSALQYIHQNHIIHRDIKPGNIFLKPDGRSWRILLGDFGLACADVTDLTTERDCDVDQPKRRTRQPSFHSIGVGTTTYAAPEQLQSSDYGPAVDVYSAGIVIFEAYSTFQTSMERLRNIEKLRADRQVTDYIQEKWSTIAPTVLAMTDVNPANRPTAGQLLQKLIGDESSSNKALQEIINAQNDEIGVLKARLWKVRRELNRYKHEASKSGN